MRKMFSKSEIETIVNDAIANDREMIKQIEVFHDGEVTHFMFPAGVMPLSISLNAHELFFLGVSLESVMVVNGNGEEVEGYTLDEYLVEEGAIDLIFEGDLSEQVINKLTYILFDNEPFPIINTYSLFFPLNPIYYHPVTIMNSSLGSVSFVIINTTSTAFSKATLISFLENTSITRISPLSGCFKKSAGVSPLVVSSAFKEENVFKCMGAKLDATIETGASSYTLNALLNSGDTYVADGVNKIH